MRFWKPSLIAGEPLVSLVVAAYTVGDERQRDALSCLLFALKAQSYANWEAIIVHDGPDSGMTDRIAALADSRIRFEETPVRRGHYGHPWRSYGISKSRGRYVGVSNGDNYYAPSYFHMMLEALVGSQADFAYCDMVHSHTRWNYFSTYPAVSAIDVGAWLADGDMVRATPWSDMGFAGDGVFIEALAAVAKKTVKVESCLFVHN
ncbi:MAG TPA: glycosyltransferase [Planctomycetia bacterium]|nr:glycosyltransferase [Planctomycetia bacterium]